MMYLEANLPTSGAPLGVQYAYTEASKRETSERLDAIVLSRLFGNGPWLVDWESGPALSRTLTRMKLQEPVPGTNSIRDTPLGRELNLEVISVFLGLWDPGEMPGILWYYDLIDQDTADELYYRLHKLDDPERALKPSIRQAYFAYQNPSRSLH